MFADVGERESGVEGMADPVILFEDRGREIAATDDFVDQFGLLGPGPGKVGSSVIVAGDLAEVGSHPCRDERKVLKELLAGRDGHRVLRQPRALDRDGDANLHAGPDR